MNIHADHLDAGKLRRMAVDRPSPRPRHAEFGLGCAGGDFGVSPRIYIRVHTDGYGCGGIQPGCDLTESFEFGFAFDIELMNAGDQRVSHFLARLADPRENDAIPRNPCRERLLEFAA